MTRQERFNQLEESCQQRYNQIDACHQSIAFAQFELVALETQYLKAKAKLESLKTAKVSGKTAKLKASLLKLGIDAITIESILRGTK